MGRQWSLSACFGSQGIMWPQVISGAAGNVINAIINYIFLHLLDLGVAWVLWMIMLHDVAGYSIFFPECSWFHWSGSAGANAISQYALAIFLFGYIHLRGLHKATWNGKVKASPLFMDLLFVSKKEKNKFNPYLYLASSSVLCYLQSEMFSRKLQPSQLWMSSSSSSSWRLVQRVPAAVGSLPPTGRAQYADALSGVVAVWDCRIPGRYHQWGGAGSSVRHVSAGCHSIRGNAFASTVPDLAPTRPWWFSFAPCRFP